MNTPQPHDPPERVTISVTDTAALLGVPPPTIYTLIRNKKLPVVRVGTRLLLLKSVVDDWIRTGEPPVVNEPAVGEETFW